MKTNEIHLAFKSVLLLTNIFALEAFVFFFISCLFFSSGSFQNLRPRSGLHHLSDRFLFAFLARRCYVLSCHRAAGQTNKRQTWLGAWSVFLIRETRFRFASVFFFCLLKPVQPAPEDRICIDTLVLSQVSASKPS